MKGGDVGETEREASLARLAVAAILTVHLLASGRRWLGGFLLLGAVATVVAAAHGSRWPAADAPLVVQAGLAPVTPKVFARVTSRRAKPATVERVAA